MKNSLKCTMFFFKIVENILFILILCIMTLKQLCFYANQGICKRKRYQVNFKETFNVGVSH